MHRPPMYDLMNFKETTPKGTATSNLSLNLAELMGMCASQAPVPLSFLSIEISAPDGFCSLGVATVNASGLTGPRRETLALGGVDGTLQWPGVLPGWRRACPDGKAPWIW